MPQQKLQPQEYIRTLASSDKYLENRTSSKNPREALGRTAVQYVEMKTENTEYADIHTLFISLIGQLEQYIEAQTKLDAAKESQSLPYNEVRSLKETVVEYVHTIREIIDSRPDLKFNDILDFVASAELILGGPERSQAIREATRRIVIGMQHEIATEQALWQIPGVDVLEADKEDDLRGIDVRFIYGNITYELDVKASEAAVADAAAKKQARGSNTTTFWTGLERDELGNGFRASDQSVDKVRERLEKVLSKEEYSDLRGVA